MLSAETIVSICASGLAVGCELAGRGVVGVLGAWIIGLLVMALFAVAMHGVEIRFAMD